MDTEQTATSFSCDETTDPLVEAESVYLNRRAHPRYAVDESSKLLLVSHGLSLQSHILDLSLEGCRLCILDPYTVGRGMRVEVSFKVNGIAFRFAGVIQWTDENHLVGIHFVDIIARRSEQLAEVVHEMQRAADARAAEILIAKELAERADEELQTGEDSKTEVEEEVLNGEGRQADELAGPDSGDIAEREARAWAEIQEIARKAKATHESDLRLHAQAKEKRDRRIEVRHSVDTTATVHLVKGGSKLSGHILDLSMNGCWIRSDEPFPVGVYTRVEAEFRLEGLPFLLGGVVQAIHGPNDVGIRFLGMSQRKREQVEQLVAEIAKLENEKDDDSRPDSTPSW
jgi:hypothetical protein